VFVEVPRAVRLARVAGRGWDGAELDRREAAQMPLDDKRARADYVVVNDGPAEDLGPRVEAILRAVLEANRQADPPGASPQAG
jgi:dephospho-CoA kinase